MELTMKKLLSIFATLLLITTSTFAIGNIKSDEVFARNFGAPSQATLEKALTAIGDAEKTLVIDGGVWTVTNDVFIPFNIVVDLRQGSSFFIDDGYTLDVDYRAGDAFSSVSFSNFVDSYDFSCSMDAYNIDPSSSIIAARIYDSDNNGVSGYNAMYEANNCAYNGASGPYAMYDATNCDYNGVSGYNAMHGATDCDDNGVSGREVMYGANDCDFNGVSGYYAMRGATDCDYNGVSGHNAMSGATDCDHNGVSGTEAMRNASNCTYNGVGGFKSMYGATDLHKSLALGAFAGAYSTGGTAQGFIDCRATDPTSAHNPTNDLIYFNDGALYLGRGDEVNNTVTIRGFANVGLVTDYADNAAAKSGGLTNGDIYRTGDILKIVHP